LQELNHWAPNVFDKPKILHELTHVATDQQTGGATGFDRDQAGWSGIAV
jgi:hypothetical protein